MSAVTLLTSRDMIIEINIIFSKIFLWKAVASHAALLGKIIRERG